MLDDEISATQEAWEDGFNCGFEEAEAEAVEDVFTAEYVAGLRAWRRAVPITAVAVTALVCIVARTSPGAVRAVAGPSQVSAALRGCGR